MNRAELLDAVSKVSSAAALGQDDADAQRNLDGKPFEIRIRFGCMNGSSSAEVDPQHFSVQFDEEHHTLRVRAAPDVSLDDPRVAVLAGKETEAVEGFWIWRWLLIAGCPVNPVPLVNPQSAAGPEIDTPPPTGPVIERRLGVAEFFTVADARTQRRDHRAYEATKTLKEGQTPSRQGYNLVLSGRLRKLPAGRVIACRMVERNMPPFCLVSANFDRVWMEVPSTKEVLAEWAD